MLQPEFQFDASTGSSGLQSWQEQRLQARRELARRFGLPLDRQVEVCLKDGVRLRGRLRLREEPLFVEDDRPYELELEADGVLFRQADIESCVTTDGAPQ